MNALTVTDEELLQKYFGNDINHNHNDHNNHDHDNHEKLHVGSVNSIAIELRRIALAGYEHFNISRGKVNMEGSGNDGVDIVKTEKQEDAPKRNSDNRISQSNKTHSRKRDNIPKRHHRGNHQDNKNHSSYHSKNKQRQQDSSIIYYYRTNRGNYRHNDEELGRSSQQISSVRSIL